MKLLIYEAKLGHCPRTTLFCLLSFVFQMAFGVNYEVFKEPRGLLRAILFVSCLYQYMFLLR